MQTIHIIVVTKNKSIAQVEKELNFIEQLMKNLVPLPQHKLN
jgi:hypothetical protein